MRRRKNDSRKICRMLTFHGNLDAGFFFDVTLTKNSLGGNTMMPLMISISTCFYDVRVVEIVLMGSGLLEPQSRRTLMNLNS